VRTAALRERCRGDLKRWEISPGGLAVTAAEALADRRFKLYSPTALLFDPRPDLVEIAAGFL
jgi:hypothetical protein